MAHLKQLMFAKALPRQNRNTKCSAAKPEQPFALPKKRSLDGGVIAPQTSSTATERLVARFLGGAQAAKKTEGPGPVKSQGQGHEIQSLFKII